MAAQLQGSAGLRHELAYADPFRLFPQSSFEPYNPNALITRKGYRIIDRMLKDEQVRASLKFKVHSVVAAGWEIESPIDKPQDWEVTEYVRDTLKEMRGTVEGIIEDLIGDAIAYGHVIAEKIYDDNLNLSQIKVIRPHEIHYRQDEFGHIIQIEQERPEGRVPMPMGKFVHWAYDTRHGNPYGQPEMESAYRGWWSKWNAYNWLGMLLERFGIPPMFFFYNPDAYTGRSLSALQEVMKNVQASTYALIPRRGGEENLTPWTPQLAADVERVFIPAIEHYDKDIAKALLMPNMIGMTQDGTQGSFARSKISFDTFMLTLNRLRQEVEETIMQEQIVRPLVDLHFNVDTYPAFKLNPIDEDRRDEILTAWQGLVGARAVRSTDKDESHIRTLLDFPEFDESEAPTEDALEEESPQEEAEEEKQFTQPESRVDFRQVERDLDTAELEIARDVNESFRRALRRINVTLQREGVEAALKGLNTSLLDRAGQRAIFNGLTRVLRKGRESFDSEVAGISADDFDIQPTEFIRDALEFLGIKSLRLASTIDNDALTAVRDALMKSLELGENPRSAMQRLQEALTPFVVDRAVDDAQLTPPRIEAIVRTETTGAFNQGRLIASRRTAADRIMAGWTYSAILDDRTTDVCQELHGTFFPKGDSAVDQLSPPNHVNCRSLLVPVTVIDDPPEPIDERKKGRARELAGKGFV